MLVPSLTLPQTARCQSLESFRQRYLTFWFRCCFIVLPSWDLSGEPLVLPVNRYRPSEQLCWDLGVVWTSFTHHKWLERLGTGATCVEYICTPNNLLNNEPESCLKNTSQHHWNIPADSVCSHCSGVVHVQRGFGNWSPAYLGVPPKQQRTEQCICQILPSKFFAE